MSGLWRKTDAFNDPYILLTGLVRHVVVALSLLSEFIFQKIFALQSFGYIVLKTVLNTETCNVSHKSGVSLLNLNKNMLHVRQ